MPTKAYKLIVFDWDGTLCDSKAHICQSMQAAMADLKLPEKTHQDIAKHVGLGLVELIEAIYPDIERHREALLMERYRYHFCVQKDEIVLFEGATETMAKLQQQGYQMAIATGKSHSGLQMALAETGVSDYFATTRTADQTSSKPHPQMLLEIMEQLFAEPSDTLMIGDTSFDLELAANASVDALAVTYGMHSKEVLKDYRALDYLSDIRELVGWLSR